MKSKLSIIFMPILILLFSFGFFCFKSEAAEMIHSSMDKSTVLTSTDSRDSKLYMFVNGSGFWRLKINDYAKYLVSDEPFTISMYIDGNLNSTINSTAATNFFGYDCYYYNVGGYVTGFYHTDDIFYTYDELINYVDPTPIPDSSFQLANFRYTTWRDTTVTVNVNDIYCLNYSCLWDGSTNIDKPITDVQFKLVGFDSRSEDITNFQNGTILDSGSCSSPFVYNVYDKVKNWNMQTDYPEFVLYLTPFSNNHEGVTTYLKCSIVSDTVTFSPFGVDINAGYIFGIEAVFDDGSIIPVNNASTVFENSDIKYYVGNDLGDFHCIGYNYNEIGYIHNGDDTFVQKNEYYYSPIIYGDTNTINEYVTNNNQVYNTYNYGDIINNFNYSPDINSSNGSLASSDIISFLKSLIGFWSTCWAYISVYFSFIPVWAINTCNFLFTTCTALFIALGFIKIIGR